MLWIIQQTTLRFAPSQHIIINYPLQDQVKAFFHQFWLCCSLPHSLHAISLLMSIQTLALSPLTTSFPKSRESRRNRLSYCFSSYRLYLRFQSAYYVETTFFSTAKLAQWMKLMSSLFSTHLRNLTPQIQTHYFTASNSSSVVLVLFLANSRRTAPLWSIVSQKSIHFGASHIESWCSAGFSTKPNAVDAIPSFRHLLRALQTNIFKHMMPNNCCSANSALQNIYFCFSYVKSWMDNNGLQILLRPNSFVQVHGWVNFSLLVLNLHGIWA